MNDVMRRAAERRMSPTNLPDCLRPAANMVCVPGGTMQMGSDRHFPEEAPVRVVAVDGFWMDPHPVKR